MIRPLSSLTRWRTEVLVIGGYLLLTLLFTYPLALHLGTYVVGLHVDVEQYLWSFWWMRRALLELHTTPFFTHWLYYPDGVSLYFFAFNPLHALLSIPFQQAFGLIPAYNLMELLTFVATAYTTYLLARDVTGSRMASFIAGIIFAFAPTQVDHFNVGQPNLHAVEFLPLYVLCLRRWLSDGALRWLAGAVIALALSSFADWQFAVYLELFTAGALLAAWLAQRQHGRSALCMLGGRLVALEILYVLAIAPILIPMLRELATSDQYMVRPREDTVWHSADLIAFFVPNPAHPLWGAWAQRVLATLTTPGVLATTVSLSYVATGLAVFGAWQRWRQARFWGVCGVAFLLLALGPQLRVSGQVTSIPLPYELLFQFKVMQVSRAPARFVIMALLCLSIVAALGVQALLARAGQRPRRLGQVAVGSMLLGVVCFELLPIPAQVQPPRPVPAFFTDGTLREAGALLEAPNPSNSGMYYATQHGHPVLYGELSRDNPPTPLVDYLRDGLFDDEDIMANPDNWACVATYYRVTHLVIYRTGYVPGATDAATFMQQANQALGPQAHIRSTPEAELYALPQVDDDTCIVLGNGWGSPRGSDGQPIYRWMGQQATVGVLRRTPGPVRLTFQAHSFAMARTLQVQQAGARVAVLTVGTPQTQHVDLTLPAGMTWLTLSVKEPPTPPGVSGNTEREPVSIGVGNLSAGQ
jgi:hypothetical protein